MTSNDDCITQFGSDATHALFLHNFACLTTLDLSHLPVGPENRTKTLPFSGNTGITLERRDKQIRKEETARHTGNPSPDEGTGCKEDPYHSSSD